MWIKNFELDDGTVMEVGKFAVLWNLFEKHFCQNKCNPKKLKEIAPEVIIDECVMMNLSKALNIRRSWFDMMISDYAKESLHPENANQSKDEDIDYMIQFLEFNGDNILLGCLLVINRLRNNLMHGLKIAEQLDNQIDLFKATNAVLETISRRK